jgi:hypothetical protein
MNAALRLAAELAERLRRIAVELELHLVELRMRTGELSERRLFTALTATHADG